MNQKFNTVEFTKMALLTALICISAYIAIPLPSTPVSLTAQTLVVNLIVLLLTPRQATLTMVVYIPLGPTGSPVSSGAMDGPGKLFGPTGGYTMSWIPVAIPMSRLKRTYYSFKRCCLVTISVGMSVIYLVGSVYIKSITGVDWVATFTAAITPSIPLGTFKYFVAALIAKPVQISLSDAQRVR